MPSKVRGAASSSSPNDDEDDDVQQQQQQQKQQGQQPGTSSINTSVDPVGTAAPTANITTTTTTTPTGISTANQNDVNPRNHQHQKHKRGPSSTDDGAAAVAAAQSPVESLSRKKRRTGVGGSSSASAARCVASLTPEQLAKKRANDREAQRAIRERTKKQIEGLEKRIRELTSQQPYQELHAALRAKEAVEAENAEMRSRLASIVALIQPLLSQGQLAEGKATLAPPTANTAPLAPAPSETTILTTPSSLACAPGDNTSIANLPPKSESIISTTTSADPPPSWSSFPASPRPSHSHIQQQAALSVTLDEQRQNLLHGLELGIGGEHLRLDFLLDPMATATRTPSGDRVDRPLQQHHHHHHSASRDRDRDEEQQHQHHQQSQSHNLEYNIEKSTITHQTPYHHHNDETSSPWIGLSAPIKNCGPTCALDALLLGFLYERRQRAAEGVSAHDVVGPRYPSISSLLNSSSAEYSHPLSKVFTDILATFPGICTLPERVAVLYIMFLVMRWQISPTKENFDLLPPWMAPVPSQIYSEHPSWIDHLPFPRMREKMAREYNPAQYLFDNFFIPFTTTLSLNWPYDATDCLLQKQQHQQQQQKTNKTGGGGGGGDDGELVINPVFERHLRRNENWTLGEAFNAAFPQLLGTYNLKGCALGGQRGGAGGGDVGGS